MGRSLEPWWWQTATHCRKEMAVGHGGCPELGLWGFCMDSSKTGSPHILGNGCGMRNPRGPLETDTGKIKNFNTWRHRLRIGVLKVSGRRLA